MIWQRSLINEIVVKVQVKIWIIFPSFQMKKLKSLPITFLSRAFHQQVKLFSQADPQPEWKKLRAAYPQPQTHLHPHHPPHCHLHYLHPWQSSAERSWRQTGGQWSPRKSVEARGKKWKNSEHEDVYHWGKGGFEPAGQKVDVGRDKAKSSSINTERKGQWLPMVDLMLNKKLHLRGGMFGVFK